MAVFTPTVRTIADGTAVNAANTNGPISDLTQRTNWLKDQITSLTAGEQLLLRSRTVQSSLVPGDVVYFNNTTSQYEGALADVDEANVSQAADSAFWQGVIQAASGTDGDIVMSGAETKTQVVWASAMEDGTFAAGDLFLSATLPGKMTTEPGSAGIYIGNMKDDGAGNGELIIRAGNPANYLQHVHYERFLLGKPAGSVVDPAFGATQVITTPNTAQQGWLPANVTYFPGFVVGVQIPTGAVYGYNLTHPSETSLNEVFPLVPPDNAQFAQEGVILGSGQIVANAYGLWWMDNSYGNAPWPVDYNASPTASDITLWTARLVASTSILDLVTQSVINSLDNGGIDTIAVAGIMSANNDDLGVSGTEGDAVNGWQGVVTLTNSGVTGMRIGRGLGISAPSGDNTTGYKGLADLEFDADLAGTHLFTRLDAANTDPDEKMQLVTTNGVSSGTSLAAYGHRLGAIATDYIDFLLLAGSTLVAATDYRVVLTLQACVDTVAGVPAAGEVRVTFYRLVNGSPVSTTQQQLSTVASFNTGLPGQLQTATIGPLASVVVRQNDQMLVRITNSTGTPLPSDTFRLVAVTYNLDET